MASVSNDSNGTRRVQFVAKDGSRKAIRLGKVPKRDAEAFKTKLEALLSAKCLGNSPDRETSVWLSELSDDLFDKLATAELIEPRQPVEPIAEMTLWAFLDDYLSRRNNDVKGGTFVFYGHTVRNLKEFFGSGKTLASINPGDADDFRRTLQQIEKLAAATVVRRCTLARTFFKDAIRRKLIDSNPFEGVGKGSTANPERQRFIDRDTISKVIDACPNAEWRLHVALSRYGGLRVPSEPLLLRWQDVDTVNWERMLVHSPKTEHHIGKATRTVPIFPELRPYFEEAYELAEDGAEWVLPSLRKPGIASGDWRNVNFGTLFGKIIKRAGLEAWPRAWHNLRSSRQTELTEDFPSHVVTAWLGNSERIAEKHYLQVLESHFQKAAQKTAQYPSASLRTGSQELEAENEKPPISQENTEKQGVFETKDWAMRDSNPRHPRCKHGALTS